MDTDKRVEDVAMWLVSIAMALRRSRTLRLAATAMVALALVTSVTSSPSDSFVATIAFENAFQLPVHNLTIQCDSDVATKPERHFLRPQETFILDANPELEHRWVCTFSTENTTGRLCGHGFSGKFVVWEHVQPTQQPWTDHPALCYSRCKWIVNAGGLWLRRYPHGSLELVYKWPRSPNC